MQRGICACARARGHIRHCRDAGNIVCRWRKRRHHAICVALVIAQASTQLPLLVQPDFDARSSRAIVIAVGFLARVKLRIELQRVRERHVDRGTHLLRLTVSTLTRPGEARLTALTIEAKLAIAIAKVLQCKLRLDARGIGRLVFVGQRTPVAEVVAAIARERLVAREAFALRAFELDPGVITLAP